MNILGVCPYYKPAYIYGGPSRSLPLLFEGLVKMDHHVTVFTTDANGRNNFPSTHPKRDASDDPNVHYFNRSLVAPHRFFYSPELAKACSREVTKYDIVYLSATWTYPFLPAAYHSIKHHIPYVIAPRGSFMEWSMNQHRSKKYLYLYLFEKTLINRARYIICTSELEMAQTAKMGLKPPLTIVPNLIEVKRYLNLPKRGRLRERLRIPDDAVVSLYVGRLHAMKRLELMIKTFQGVLLEVKNSHLLIVGSDEDGTEYRCKNLVKDYGFQENVHFTGLLEGNDLLQTYADADIFVMISHRENFGMAAAEAMASGLPVIIGKEVGISGFIESGRVGNVVDATSDEFVKTWKELCLSAALRKKIGENARQFVTNNFSSEIIAKQMSRLFEQAIQR